MALPRPPGKLGQPGLRFWRRVLGEYDLTEAHDLERLFQAARCLDEIGEAEAVVLKEGRFVSDRFGQRKEHPASAAIRDGRTLLLRALRELGLDLTAPPDPRPKPRY